MEARYLQSELQLALEGRKCFLDSDDLHDLTRLVEAVRQSDVLVLLQSAHVLERPWCLIEIQTALDCGIPIVGVSLTSGKHAYDFGASTAYLNDFETALEAANPGAMTVLLENDVAVADLDWKLASTLPSIISIGFNPSASKNVLAATLSDIVEGIKAAEPVTVPPREQWLRRRGSVNGMSFKQKGSSAGGGPAPAAPQPAAAAAPAAPAAPAAAAAVPPPRSSPATIPPEVPELPEALQMRPEILDALKAGVLGSSTSSAAAPTAVVGVVRKAAAATAAHGMGGVGKTMAAAQLIRDGEVGMAFDRLLWVSVSATPDLFALLRILHFQLKSERMPESVESERDALQVLREAASGVKALLVLDDCWDSKPVDALNCVDAGCGSACVITTRIRNLASAEVSCGLLTRDESLALLLTSAGLAARLAEPPAAAIEAVECCGRLALALPIAGGIIRELEDVWETELVPLLREGALSEEASVEERIVNASLRCVEQSQRHGVEALFTVFGLFAEDETVPAAVVDVLAPLVCARAAAGLPSGAAGGAATKLKVRKWLGWLLKASLLSGTVARGVSVHDLVRDVMISRIASSSDGGMVTTQRDAIALLLAAHDDAESKDAVASGYASERLRWHVSQAVEPTVAIHDDPLLMSLLAHKTEQIRSQAVLGIGEAIVLADADACDATGEHLTAAKLAFAVCAGKGNAAGTQADRAWESLKRLTEESGESRALEMNVLLSISMATNNELGGRDSTKNKDVYDRMAALGQLLTESAAADGGGGGAGGSYSSKSDDAMQAEIGLSIVEAMKSWSSEGLANFATVTSDTVIDSLANFQSTVTHLHAAAAAAPTEGGRMTCLNLAIFFAVDYPRKYGAPAFDLSTFFGRDGSWLRELVTNYSFERDHKISKEIGFKTDLGCSGPCEMGLLLFYGDLATAKVGWANCMATYAKIDALIASGDATVDGYTYELWNAAHHFINGLLLAGELGLVKTFLQLQCVQKNLLTDETSLAGFWAQWGAWESDGHVHSTRASWMLIVKAVAALLSDDESDTDESKARLRTWLPPVEELLRIAELEGAYCTHAYGQTHPCLLCASLHGERLGDWAVPKRIAARLLELEEFNPVMRVGAGRLLSKAHARLGEDAEASAAAERAADDAARGHCIWLEMLALRDQLTVTGDEEAKAAIWARLLKVMGKMAATADELIPLLGEEVQQRWQAM